MRHRKLLMIVGGTAMLLAGCASPSRPEPRPASATAAPVPSRSGSAAPGFGTGELFGRTAQSLVTLFGQPALDVQEGTARKLQFSGQSCVLDAYLYPREARGEAVVTHIDARSPDGRDADRAACIQSLRSR